MKFNYASGVYSFQIKQDLPISLEEAWHFFSSPGNLEKITPKDLTFSITGKVADEIFEGQIITYKIGIFPFIKTDWVTEIKAVEKFTTFTDQQLYGPYKLWHHRHVFAKSEKGTLVTDEVHFRLPFHLIHWLIFPLIIKPKLKKVFNYRQDVLSKLFT